MYKKIFISASLLGSIMFANQNIIPMSNINGNTGSVFIKGKMKVGIINELCSKSTAYNGDTEVSDNKNRLNESFGGFKLSFFTQIY